MKSLMVFDLDSTLAKSKSPVEVDMAELFEKLMAVMSVAIIDVIGTSALRLRVPK